MKVTIHSININNVLKHDTHYFDTYVFEKDITEYEYTEIAEKVKGCIEDCTGMVIKSVIVE